MKEDENLRKVCNWLLKNTKETSKIRVSVKGGKGLIIDVHSKIKEAMIRYAKLLLKNHEKRIKKLENLVEGKVPCSINDGKFCKKPFCKYVYYSTLAQKSFEEWKKEVKKELKHPSKVKLWHG